MVVFKVDGVLDSLKYNNKQCVNHLCKMDVSLNRSSKINMVD